MAKITIEVAQEIAQLYQNMSKSEQEQIQLKLTEIISFKLETRRQKAIVKLSEIMDQASNLACANGLTPEILEEILADE